MNTVQQVALHCAVLAILASHSCSDPRVAGGAPSPASTVASAPVWVLAAASTVDALNELTTPFAKLTGLQWKISAGASSALANQVLAGVPAEVFLSASPEWVEMLAAHGCVQEQQQLLSNRLVIVVPRSNPARVTVPEDLLSGRVRRVALAGEKTPAGIYAEQALRKYGVYDRMIAANRIARGAHVRLTLGFVLAGEAEAGVVYATDARAAGKHLEVVFTFPEDAHQPIIYSLVLLKSSKIHDASRRVYDYLRSAQAHAVFKQHGFLPAREVD